MSPQGPRFTLERFELGDGGRLEVAGRWSGVRGMRFVRPALVVDGLDGEQTALATLEHKPWTPSEGDEWVAAFPWTGGPIDPAHARLAVGPSIEVPVGSPGKGSSGQPRRMTMRERS